MRIPPELAATLLAAVDAGTLDGAAKTLRLTPSAVSQRIRALETQLGRVLLVREKPVRVTVAGEPILRLARQLALLEHEALAELGASEASRARIPIAVNADSLETWLLAPLAAAAERLPILVEAHREDEAHTARMLESGAAMAAVTSRGDPVPGCTATPLGTMRYRAVATPAFIDRWFGPGGEGWASAPRIDFDTADDMQGRRLRELGVDPHLAPAHRIPSSAGFAAAVLAGVGWGMLPELQSRQPLADGRLVALDGPPLDVALHWQQWHLRSELLDALAAEVGRAASAALRPE